MKKSLLTKVCLVGMAAILFSCFQCEPYCESVLNIRNTSYEQIYFMAYKNGEPSSYTLKCGEDFNYWLEGETKSFLSIIAPYDSCILRKDCAHGEILKIWRKNYPINSQQKEFFREDDWELIKSKETWNYTFTIDDGVLWTSTNK